MTRKPIGILHWYILGDPGADSGGKGKTKWAEKNGAKKSKERREELFSPFFTFLCAIFFHPFSLSLAPTMCPWVSEDDIDTSMEKICQLLNTMNLWPLTDKAEGILILPLSIRE